MKMKKLKIQIRLFVAERLMAMAYKIAPLGTEDGNDMKNCIAEYMKRSLARFTTSLKE